MLNAVRTMLDLQDRMNTKVHPEWRQQGFEWYRAAWIECAELMDHAGYKWWKHADPDREQIQLEVVDIWHFGMSAMICDSGSLDDLAAQIAEDLAATPIESSILEATESLAQSCITTQSFSTSAFLGLMVASDLSFEQLFRIYIGKNVLNFFRQDHGYKDGSYIKIWDGREDNEHLSDLLVRLDPNQTDFADAVYQGLAAVYPG
jgi:dimeric dUTPase (all-alpha-NTP-PPase superfamily)